jgi:hypothetical protein
MALFIDAGKVVPRLGDVNLNGLKKAYGVHAPFRQRGGVRRLVGFERIPEGS